MTNVLLSNIKCINLATVLAQLPILSGTMEMGKPPTRWVLGMSKFEQVGNVKNTFGANEFFFVLLPHPSFSPDLARSDFYLFIELKFNFFGHRYERDDDVINAVDAYLEAQDLTFFHQGIEKQEHRWTKCIEVIGDYIEK